MFLGLFWYVSESGTIWVDCCLRTSGGMYLEGLALKLQYRIKPHLHFAIRAVWCPVWSFMWGRSLILLKPCQTTKCLSWGFIKGTCIQCGCLIQVVLCFLVILCDWLSLTVASQGQDPGQENQCAHWAHQALKEQGQLPAARQGEREAQDRGQAAGHMGWAEASGTGTIGIPVTARGILPAAFAGLVIQMALFRMCFWLSLGWA